MPATLEAPKEQQDTHVTTPTISPREFVDVLKCAARGEGMDSPLRERCAAFLAAYLIPGFDGDSPSKVDRSECERVKGELREELRVNLREILGSRAPQGISQEDREIMREAKRVSAELYVAFSNGLAPLSHDGEFFLADIFQRGEEARHLKGKDTIGALQLALNRLETLCRGFIPDKIGVGAVEKGLKSSPYGSEILAKLGSGFFQAHRNDLLHARGDDRRDLAVHDINTVVTFLMSRVSPVGVVDQIADPVYNAEGIESLVHSHLGAFQRRTRESESELITDEMLDQLARGRALGRVQEWVDDGIIDLTNKDDRDLVGSAIPLEEVVPIADVCDFRVRKALSLVRESAEAAIARAGVPLKRGEDPLRVLFGKETEKFFGASEDRSKGWGVVIKELLKTEKEGGYFKSGRPDVMAGTAAYSSIAEKFDTATLQRLAMQEESDFVVSLCAILTHDLDSLSFAPSRDDNAPATTAPVERLRQDITRYLTDDASTPSKACIDYSLTMEARFTELADRFVPQWRATKPSGVALEAHALQVFFNAPEVRENFKRIGVAEADVPKVAEMVKALFFAIKTSWVHNATARPNAGDVGHILQAAQLLNDLTLVAEGKPMSPRLDRSSWGVADLAEAASLHSVVFNWLSNAIVDESANAATSKRFDRYIRDESLRGNSPVGEEGTGGAKVNYFAKSAQALSEGLVALQGTSILPESHTTAGVLSRGALISLWLRLQLGLKSDPSFPLWQVYCKASDSH